ncbi:SGNH hydrolase domain-containing protein, partial [Duganella sp.]|uniref:SGNH hydrolase domain-containing protein n=1 Tax=Duganella sp. TaxID=1904440 RepID=UPI0039C8621B
GADRCDAVVNQRPLYFDDNHLSRYGASLLTPMFSTIFDERQSAKTAAAPAPAM